MHCTNCGARLLEHGRFCATCGERVLQQQTAPTPLRAAPLLPRRERRAVIEPAPAPMSPPSVSRGEAAAALSARGELGDRYEPEVVDAFADRVEHVIAERVHEEVAAQMRVDKRPPRRERGGSSGPRVAISSLIFGIPLSAVAGGTSGLAGLIVCWTGIALVNLAVNGRFSDAHPTAAPTAPARRHGYE